MLILVDVDVRRKDSDQQSNDAPRCQSRETSNQQKDAKHDLTNATQIDQFPVQRQVWRHDLDVEVGIDEVHRASADHEDRQHVF